MQATIVIKSVQVGDSWTLEMSVSTLDMLGPIHTSRQNWNCLYKIEGQNLL